MKRTITAALTLALVTLPLIASANEINNREAHQEARIYQGVKNGSLTQGEFDRLQHREGNIYRQIQNDRTRNGGNLTAKQWRQINREDNRTSRAIYRDKHN